LENTTWTAADQPPKQNSQLVSKETAEKIEASINNPLLVRSMPVGRGKSYFETEQVTLEHASFKDIAKLGSWFDDDMINAGFDILERIFKCKDHGVTLLNVNYAWVVFRAGYNPDGDLQEAKEVIKKIDNSGFIFIPISDGWLKSVGTSEEEREKIDKVLVESGAHWSLLAIDCRTPIVTWRHFDSYGRGGWPDNKETVPIICVGLNRILQELRPNYYSHEEDSCWDSQTPSQSYDNACISDSGGACGPFVYAIAKELTQYIVECHEDEKRRNTPVPITIALPLGFRREFNWDSKDTRMRLSRLIERERRCRMLLNNGTYEWWTDRVTGVLGWKEWLETHDPPLPLDYFWDPYEYGGLLGAGTE
jgi:hypothetical protein